MPDDELLIPREISGQVLPDRFFHQVLPAVTHLDELFAFSPSTGSVGVHGQFRPYFVLEAINSTLAAEGWGKFSSWPATCHYSGAYYQELVPTHYDKGRGVNRLA